MRRYRFPIAVAITSLALVGVIGVAGVLTVRTALANSPWAGGPWAGHFGFGGPGFQIPPELQALGSLPPAERFDHFMGVQVSLKDKDNQPLTIHVSPGTVTAADAGSVTMTANDGTIKTFTLNDKTIMPNKPNSGGAQANQQGLAAGDKVVVVTLNDSTAATAVINGGKDGFSGGYPGGPWNWGH